MVNAPLWLQLATAAAVTFAAAMFAILLYRWLTSPKRVGNGFEVSRSPYACRAAILSPAGQHFYARLAQAVGEEMMICPKVRLPDAVAVRADALEWQAAWNRIAAREVDFLLVDPATFRPLLAVELEESGARDRLDERLERAILAAGLPILRITATGDYDPVDLKQQVDQHAVARS